MKQHHKASFHTKMPVDAERLFQWHMQPAAFLRMLPPWHRVDILSYVGKPSDIGSIVEVGFRPWLFWPFSLRWSLQHTECKWGEFFVDQQVHGPFRFWRHVHRMIPQEEQAILADEIEFSVFSEALYSKLMKEITKVFKWRHKRLLTDLSTYSRYLLPDDPFNKKRILVTGASGLIGSNLVSFLRAGGHEVVRLVRKTTSAQDAITWNPQSGVLVAEQFEDFDAVIHLAGDNISAKRWTKLRKKELFQSRCRDTWLLAHALARVKNPPRAFISASAIGFYGNRGEETLTEESNPGSGFLSDLCQEWEKVCNVLKPLGTRVVHARLGAVLTPQGGILKRLLPLFRLGLGAVLGKGEQWFSWIAADDAIYALYHILMTEQLQGAVNLTSPHSLRNRDFSQLLAKACGKRLFLRLPAPLMRILFGEISDAMLLASARVVPEKLIKSGFLFTSPEIASTLPAEY